LAVGIPGEDVSGKADAGAVMVLFGGAGGIVTNGTKRAFITRGSVAQGSEGAGDLFGFSLTWGEFGNGPLPDLAIGAPGRSIPGPFGITLQGVGEVDVLYKFDTGFGAPQTWSQNSTGIADVSEPGDHFGATLTGGNLGAAAQDDLAIGVADEDLGSLTDAGAVHALYGGATGLTATGSQFWTQDSSGIEEDSETGDRYGAALTIGDFDGNGVGDLAVGVPLEDVFSLAAETTVTDAGAVSVIHGTASGLSAAGDEFVTQKNTNGEAHLGTGDQFGSALAAGDFNGDGVRDLAAGAPFEDILGIGNTGQVNVLFGSGIGLGAAGAQTLDGHDFGGLAVDDKFGSSVAAWNFNGDPFTDIAIGIPFRDANFFVHDTGAVGVEYGSTTIGALDASTAQVWTQNSPGVLDQAEAGDRFGLDLY
jgi:hypothetical protein